MDIAALPAWGHSSDRGQMNEKALLPIASACDVSLSDDPVCRPCESRMMHGKGDTKHRAALPFWGLVLTQPACTASFPPTVSRLRVEPQRHRFYTKYPLTNDSCPPHSSLSLHPLPPTAFMPPLASVEKRVVRCSQIYAWYDNEWGYSKRMAELTCKVARTFFS